MKIQTGYVQTGDGKLYYETTGEGQALVMLHAGFVDSGMWNAQWQALSNHFQVVRFDMLGYGKSDPARGPVNRRQHLSEVLTQLAIERAFLIGCSLGGEIIIDFALEHPERVSGLVPVSAVPSGFVMKGEPPHNLLDMIGALQQGDLARASELQIRIWVDGMFRQPEQVDTAVRHHAAEMNLLAVKNGTLAMTDMQPANPLNPPALERLDTIRVPTLVIAGALDHPEILRAADMMVNSIIGAQKIILPDCAHVPNMERPAEFNAAILSFLGPGE